MRDAPLISVIDDDESLRLATASLLSSMGYVAECFESAEAFLDSGDAARFDCIVSDIQMPGMTGIDLIRQLREGLNVVPVILMTARLEHALLAQTLESGAVCLLRKPFAADRLLECVSKGLTDAKSL